MIWSGRKLGQTYLSLMNAPHGALVICASEQHKLAIMAFAHKLGRADVRAVKYDEVLTTDPADRECCEPHGCPVPCEECRKVVQDEQADWKEDR